MLGALTLLLAYQLAGEVLEQLSGMPVPGPVVGMLLLFVKMGAFAGLAMGLNGLLTAFLFPLLLRLWGG